MSYISPYDHSRAAAIIYEAMADYGIRSKKEEETEELAVLIADVLMEEGCINRSGAAKTKQAKAKRK